MIFWLVIGILLAGTLFLFSRTVFGDLAYDADASGDIALYKRQLEELKREQELGLIGEAEANSAQLEIERRLLRAGEAERAPSQKNTQKKMAVLVLAIVPLMTLFIYWQVGSPGLPGVPFGERAASSSNAPDQGDIEEALVRLEEHLAQNEGDVDGWALLAETYAQLQRHGEASSAYRKAIALQPGSALLQASFGETLVMLASGRVDVEAATAFEKALDIDPLEPRAQYYNALADYQNGKASLALEKWVGLIKSSPAGAPWLSMVREQIELVAKEEGVDSDALLAGVEPRAAMPQGPFTQSGVPEGEAADAIQAMSQEEQTQVIADMVAGLAVRLESEPDDLEGWRMLARSYEVLGRTSDAELAYINLGKALQRQGDEAGARAQWRAILEKASPTSAAYQEAEKLLASSTP